MSVSQRPIDCIAYDTVDSTNLEAKRLLADGRIAGPVVITAQAQASGMGSRGRSWASPKDAGIYMTVVDLPPEPLDARAIDLTLFTQAAGMACAEVLREETGLLVGIKPVNDLFVEGRKLGGILTEAVVEQNRIKAVLTGVGINVRAANRPVAPHAAEPVALQALLATHAFAHLDEPGLISHLAERILKWNRLVWRGDGLGVRNAWGGFVMVDKSNS